MPGVPDRAEVLLEQRPPTESVMPGLWELPALAEVPNGNTRITVRHSIMNVNYIVRIRDAREDELVEAAGNGGVRRWVPVGDVGGMALTGLARKVLKRVIVAPSRNPAA